MQHQNRTTVKSLPSNVNDLELHFTTKAVLPMGGLTLLARFIRGLGLPQALDELIVNKPRAHNSYHCGELLTCFIVAVMCGMQRLAQLFRNLDRDILTMLLGMIAAKAHSMTMRRVFGRIRTEVELEHFTQGIWTITKHLCGALTLQPDWLVFDSTVLTRYGSQEKAKKGYNSTKPGRKSHHPLLASLCEQSILLDIVNREGSAYTTKGIAEFFVRARERMRSLGCHMRGVLADSGFYAQDFLTQLEDCGCTYIINAKFYSTLATKVTHLTSWRSVAPGIAIAEFMFAHTNWHVQRRYIAVRRDVGVHPDAVGKKLVHHEQLFLPGIEKGSNYRYSCFVTSLTDDAVDVWRSYRRRALIERQIEDLTYEFSFKKINAHNFEQTSAMMAMLLLSFNIYTLFARTVLPVRDVRKKLSTIRSELFMVGAVVGRQARTQVLRLSVRDRAVRLRLKYIDKAIQRALEHIRACCDTATLAQALEGVTM